MALPAIKLRMTDISASKAAAEYLTYFASGDSHTARAKSQDLEHFLALIGERSLSEITPGNIRSFLESRARAGEAASTIGRRFATVRHFLNYALRKSWLEHNPCWAISAPRIVPARPKRVSPQQVAEISEQLTTDSYHHFCELIAFQLLIGCGLRRDELRRITIENLDLEAGLIVNLIGKGNNCEAIAIPRKTIESLKIFLEVREEHLIRNGFRYGNVPARVQARYPLLASTSNPRSRNPLCPEDWRVCDKTIYNWIAALGKKTGKHVHPHQLRHTFGDSVLKATKCVRTTAKALRHQSLALVVRYTELTEEDIRRVIDSAEFESAVTTKKEDDEK